MINQDFAPALEQYCLRQLRFRKAVSTSHVNLEIHATAFQSIQFSQTPPWKSPRATGAREVAEILNIARSAGPPAILRRQTLRKTLLLARGAAHGISAKSWFFMKISKFHHHGWKFGAPITFSNKFSGSSYLHHPKLHIKIWGWTKENANYRQNSEHVSKNQTKIS